MLESPPAGQQRHVSIVDPAVGIAIQLGTNETTSYSLSGPSPSSTPRYHFKSSTTGNVSPSTSAMPSVTEDAVLHLPLPNIENEATSKTRDSHQKPVSPTATAMDRPGPLDRLVRVLAKRVLVKLGERAAYDEIHEIVMGTRACLDLYARRSGSLGDPAWSESGQQQFLGSKNGRYGGVIVGDEVQSLMSVVSGR
jgi:hypothetical protein